MAAAGSSKGAKDLWGALRQLVARLRPDRWRIAAAAAIGSVGVGFTVAAPRIIGNATNVLFDGLIGKAIGKSLPPGTSQAQAEAYLRLHGQGQLAQMLSGTTVTPGQGIQFNQLGVDLGVVALLFLLGAFLSWGQGYIMAGVAQRTVSGCAATWRPSSPACHSSTSTAIPMATC
jgi:ATP-binding cassette subfamily B protein